MADLLDEVKTALRLQRSTTDFDEEEIIPLINACKIDLRMSGVNQIDESDPCIRRAIVIYCKANFGYREDSEKFAKAYENFKQALSLSGDYNSEAERGNNS